MSWKPESVSKGEKGGVGSVGSDVKVSKDTQGTISDFGEEFAPQLSKRMNIKIEGGVRANFRGRVNEEKDWGVCFVGHPLESMGLTTHKPGD